MKKFFAIRSKDSGDAYIKALTDYGYTESDLPSADFILSDYERPTISRITDKPVFFYPHTPYAWWLWDGVLDPNKFKPACNFVVGDTALRGMKDYNYPHRAEACGYSRCDVREFNPTSGKRLRYSFPHPMGKKQEWFSQDTKNSHHRVMNWLIGNRRWFDNITISYYHSLEVSELSIYSNYGFTFQDVSTIGKLSTETTLKQLEGFDFVIACNTFAYTSVARGIPTVVCGKGEKFPQRENYRVDHFDQFAHYYQFPISLFDMNGADIENFCKAPNPEVEEWKRGSIGESFQAEKFISIVREYV
jgi:hypothetical protein